MNCAIFFLKCKSSNEINESIKECKSKIDEIFSKSKFCSFLKNIIAENMDSY